MATNGTPESSANGHELKNKSVFTTGDVAKICKVSQQTVIRCFDSGELKGFKVPGSRFRRIPKAALETFMTDYGIPMEYLTGGAIDTSSPESAATETTSNGTIPEEPDIEVIEGRDELVILGKLVALMKTKRGETFEVIVRKKAPKSNGRDVTA